MASSTPPPYQPRNEVSMNLGELFITIVTSHDYPDVIDDMTKRARELAKGVLEDAKLVGVDIHDIFEGVSPQDFDDEDEEEDAE